MPPDSPNNTFPPAFKDIGVVEGFYGEVWRPAARYWFIEQLMPYGLNTYLYAPKHEKAFGAELLRPLAKAESQRLEELAGFLTEREITPWAGLHFEPPFHPQNPDHQQRAAARVAELWRMGYRGFAVLFDDLASHLKNPDGTAATGGSLAQAQAAAFNGVRAEAERRGVGARWWVCPSKYTLDALLIREYGEFEEGYLDKLHAGLPPDVAWFWTGPRVCSTTVAPADRQAFMGNLHRPLVLWDNYPVNDASMVNFLHLGPLSGRAADLPQAVESYLFNPMSQAILGAVPGATCLLYANNPTGYDTEDAWETVLEDFLPPEARLAVDAFEALTRRSNLTDRSAEQRRAPFGRGEALRALLESHWAKQDLPIPEDLSREWKDLMRQVQAGLPPEMAEEAAPWLERLEQAWAIFSAATPTSRNEQIMRFRQGKAFVLGKWFNP
ncbi:MAG: protein O-GlcNAcase [Deltaproteobacteria bacterium]|nr:protein O-GlcNAcase [Deltaproteobacteria bacterium]